MDKTCHVNFDHLVEISGESQILWLQQTKIALYVVQVLRVFSITCEIARENCFVMHLVLSGSVKQQFKTRAERFWGRHKKC